MLSLHLSDIELISGILLQGAEREREKLVFRFLLTFAPNEREIGRKEDHMCSNKRTSSTMLLQGGFDIDTV